MADESTTETTNSTETPQSAAPASTETSQEQGSPTSTTGTLLTPAADVTSDNETGKPVVEQTEDTRTDEQKAADADAEAARAELFGAPAADAEYTIDGLPDGMTVDKAALDAITPLAREFNLSDKGMSKFAQVYANDILPGVAKQIIDGVNADVAATQKAWVVEATTLVNGATLDDGTKVPADPTFGGKTMPQVQAVAFKAIERFGGEDFRKFCEETGMGNNPALLKFAFLAGSSISEDTGLERGGGQPVIPKSREEKYFPRMTNA